MRSDRKSQPYGTSVPLAVELANFMIFAKNQPWGGLPGGQVVVGLDLFGRGQSDRKLEERSPVARLLQQLWNEESGQDIAEYAVMLAVILVIVVGTIRLIGSNANNVFSQVGSAIQ
jgi:Flp pilus assembly pilin Flp